MASHATPLFARLQLHDAAHSLQFVEVLVQHLQVKHLAGRHLELGGAIRLHRHGRQHPRPEFPIGVYLRKTAL
jgi:hypothetical protein